MQTYTVPILFGRELLKQLQVLVDSIEPNAQYDRSARSTLYRIALQLGVSTPSRGFVSDSEAVLAAMYELAQPCRPADIAQFLHRDMGYKRIREYRAFRNTVIECLNRLDRRDLVIREGMYRDPIYRLSPKYKAERTGAFHGKGNRGAVNDSPKS